MDDQIRYTKEDMDKIIQELSDLRDENRRCAEEGLLERAKNERLKTHGRRWQLALIFGLFSLIVASRILT